MQYINVITRKIIVHFGKVIYGLKTISIALCDSKVDIEYDLAYFANL